MNLFTFIMNFKVNQPTVKEPITVKTPKIENPRTVAMREWEKDFNARHGIYNYSRFR